MANSQIIPIVPARPTQFIVPDLCNVTAVTLLVLFGELLVLVLLFAGGEVSWVRLALMSLLVQWIALVSAGVLCLTRRGLARLPLVGGAVVAFAIVMLITLAVGLFADRLLVSFSNASIDWQRIGAQLVVSGILAALALRYFYVQHRLRLQEQAELKSRIQALQSRIRPHFLFNSMNIIASLISIDPETAEAVVEDLSELFRASLNEAGNQVPIASELDLCQRYVRIESLRLGDRLQMDWQLETPPAGSKMPLLTLQPLLENAIYHGIQPRPEGGTIEVKMVTEGDLARVTIKNPIPEERAQGGSQGNQMAMSNIRSRLEVLYGSRASLTSVITGEQYVTELVFPLRADELGT